MAHSDFGGDLNMISQRPPGSWPIAVVRTKVVVGHSLWKASEVDSDQTLHMYIVKHDPFGTAKVVVGVSIAMHALIFVRVHVLLAHTIPE